MNPPLKRLHPDQTLEGASLRYWRQQPTERIIASLRRDAREPLCVKSDGTIVDGNTRIKALEERGYDVDGLPRVTHTTRTFNWEDGY